MLQDRRPILPTLERISLLAIISISGASRVGSKLLLCHWTKFCLRPNLAWTSTRNRDKLRRLLEAPARNDPDGRGLPAARAVGVPSVWPAISLWSRNEP